MSLFDEIAEEQKATTANRCVFRRLREELSEEDYADFEKAIADSAITNAAISRALKRRGVKADPKGISSHRKGICACTR